MNQDDNRTHLQDHVSLLKTGLFANETLVVDLFDKETTAQNDSEFVFLLALCEGNGQDVTGWGQFDSPADQQVHK